MSKNETQLPLKNEWLKISNFTNCSIFRSRWSSGVGGSGGGSSGRSSAGARDSRRQTRVIRTGRDRGSGLLGSQPQPVIPASVIPEELISQVCGLRAGRARVRRG